MVCLDWYEMFSFGEIMMLPWLNSDLSLGNFEGVSLLSNVYGK